MIASLLYIGAILHLGDALVFAPICFRAKKNLNSSLNKCILFNIPLQAKKQFGCILNKTEVNVLQVN